MYIKDNRAFLFCSSSYDTTDHIKFRFIHDDNPFQAPWFSPSLSLSSSSIYHFSSIPNHGILFVTISVMQVVLVYFFGLLSFGICSNALPTGDALAFICSESLVLCIMCRAHDFTKPSSFLLLLCLWT